MRDIIVIGFVSPMLLLVYCLADPFILFFKVWISYPIPQMRVKNNSSANLVG